jgi:hypothetical protein
VAVAGTTMKSGRLFVSAGKCRMGQGRPKRSPSFVILTIALTAFVLLSLDGGVGVVGQKRQRRQKPAQQNEVTLTSHSRDSLTPEAREMMEIASGVVCNERIKDPKGSLPIDDMQARPSLPVRSPEAVAGAQRAQRLLPTAKSLVMVSLKQLANEYGFVNSRAYNARLQRAIAHVEAVRNIRPDVASRDNASVFLRNPHTIVFGTIFLAGLPSDEGIISVLAHELVHIADGSEDSLSVLFRGVGNRASKLTGMQIHDQRAEELTCDLVGTLAARSFVASSPSYEPLPRRISRSLEHNCVSQDEGDDDHLSPRNTIRALLALDPVLSRQLVYGR